MSPLAERIRVVAMALGLVAAHCGRPATPLVTVSLPDLSRTDRAVRAQLQERLAAVERARSDSATSSHDMANAFGELGRLFLAAELPAAAEPCFLNAQALAPGEMSWTYYLAHAHRLQGDLASAAASFDRALQLQATDVPSLIWNGRVEIELGRPERAEALFSRALAQSPGMFAAQFGRGRVALERRDYARAVRELEAALAIAPSASVVHYPLALAYRGAGDQARADAHMELRGTIDIAPPDPLMAVLGTLLESPLAYQRRGIDALERGAWGEAAALFRTGIELDPDVPSMRESLRNKLGSALFQMGDTAGARRQFEEGIRESPGYAPHHVGLGLLLALEGRDHDAVRSFQTAVRADSSSVEAHLQLGDALRRTGMFGESLQQYDHVLRLDSRVSDAVFGSAMALVRLDRYGEAISRLTEGTRRHGRERRFTHALARLLATVPDARVRDGLRALSLVHELQASGTSVDLAETLAMALAELGRFMEASHWQREVIAAVKEGGGAPRRVRALLATLAQYERHQPCRTPWALDDPVHRPSSAFK